MQETAGLSGKREAKREERVTVIPRCPSGVGCREAVVRLAAFLVDVDGTDANWWAGSLALALLCVELTVNKDDAITYNLPARAHLLLPLARTSQIS